MKPYALISLTLALLLCLTFDAQAKKAKKEQKEANVDFAEMTVPDTTVSEMEQDTVAVDVLEVDDCEFFRNFYKEYMLKQLAADKKVLSLPYSQLCIDTLDALSVKYVRIADEPEVKAFNESVSDALTNLAQLAILHAFIAEDVTPDLPSYPTAVKETIDGIKGKLTPEQKQEFDDYEEVIGLYPRAVELLQERINDIRLNIDREGCMESKAFYQEIKNSNLPQYLDENRIKMERHYNVYYSKIPFLKVRYNKWLQALKNDPLSPDAIAIEDEILSIKVTN